jgi:eukaryotic-like serine/threonine-protein kinase
MQSQILGGRYQIIAQLGKGGFGVTFLALDMQRPGNPKCVVKQFQPMFVDPHTMQVGQKMFNQEAEILEKLGYHDQIPRLLAHFEENQEFYIAQEFVEGHDISVELPLAQQHSEVFVIKLLYDILEVLTFVHQNNAIHRDIKPSNVRRRQSDNKIVLIDFGSVKQISTQVINAHGQTYVTVPVGTFGYMPSEQANGTPHFSSDIYAVGMIGLQALTGVSPISLPTDQQTGEIVWRDRVEVNPQLANILDTMVRYDFRQRYRQQS